MSTHTIHLKIKNESDLYNSFDPDYMTISEDVQDYILNKAQDRNPGERVEICVLSNEMIDIDHFNSAINYWNEDALNDIQKEYRQNTLQQVWMFLVGVAFIALSLILETKIHVVWYTVLSTIGAFSMWEAASIWIVQNPKLRRKRIVLEHLKRNSKITFKKPDDSDRF